MKDFLAVETNELDIWFSQFLGKPDWLSLEWDEILFKGWLRKVLPKSLAQKNVHVTVEGDETRVKRRIVKGGKAKSVSRIQPVAGKDTPRSNVTRHQQTRDIDAADAATNIVRCENGLPEKLLAAPDFHCSL